MKIMKIAHIVWGLETGGVETMLVNIINEQVKTEEVALFIINKLYYPPLISQLSSKCRVFCFGRKVGSHNPFPLLKFNIQLRLYHPDIVHLHTYKQSDIIWGHYNMVRTIHSTINKSREYPHMKALFAISESVKEVVLQQGFNSIVIENGVPFSRIRKKNEYSVKNGFYQLIQVSRLDVSSKGQDLLVEAANILVNQRSLTNFRIFFIGEGHSRAMLEEMIQRYYLQDYFYFEGQKPQDWLREHLADYDCFIQPSRYEGFGLTVAEAMAARLPVLVSNIEGPMEIIDNGKVGMCFEAGNITDLADKIEKILRGKYDYSMIDKASSRVKSKYDVSITAQRYIREYKNVIKK